MSNNLDAEIKELVSLILDDYKKGRDIDEMDIHGQPDRDEVRSVTRKLIHILFPGKSVLLCSCIRSAFPTYHPESREYDLYNLLIGEFSSILLSSSHFPISVQEVQMHASRNSNTDEI